MRGRGVARGGQEGVLPRARTHYARPGPGRAQRWKASGQRLHMLGAQAWGVLLVTGRRQLTGSAKGQCSHKAH
ncbi:hypothetical protein C3488_19725 [Streptomyces sp. Ru72]|nr:hypothetical protein C3488_19725 [Streptomyces sp. Ru72]